MIEVAVSCCQTFFRPISHDDIVNCDDDYDDDNDDAPDDDNYVDDEIILYRTPATG